MYMLFISPHSAHKAQPLDIFFFGPCKPFYCESKKWMADHQITIYRVASVFTKTATAGNVMKGFQVCHLNKDIFSELDLLPSVVPDISSLVSSCLSDTSLETSISLSQGTVAFSESGTSGRIPIPWVELVENRRQRI